MNPLRTTRRAHARLAKSSGLLVLLLLGAPGAAIAQYMWIDDKGVKQLSDRPPPPSVPAKRILKAPGKAPFNPNATLPDGGGAPTGAGSAESAAEAGASTPPTLAERNEAFNKRRADAAAAERKNAEDARQKADTAANCEAARQNQRALEQGIRMVNVDKSGERVIMSEPERAELGKKNQKVLAGCQ